MNNTTQLFVRACKSKDPNKRIRSVYRRFYRYGATGDAATSHIASILLDICDQYKLISLADFAAMVDKNYYLNYLQNDSYTERVLLTCISAIRNAEVKKFPGLTPPLRFR